VGGVLSRPVLTTTRLRLEPLTAAHADAVSALDGDPEVMRFITGRARPPHEVLADWVPMMTRDVGPDGALGYWVGSTIAAEPAFVGWWCLTPDPEVPAAAELGYRLRREAWGHGYAAEGATALLGHGFDTVGLDHVWAQTMAVNTRSRSVLTRIGLRLERTWVGEWNEPIPGWEQGEVGYGLRRAEWQDRKT
jgi:RimJ/RimL family protein N-acetyltransferase